MLCRRGTRDEFNSDWSLSLTSSLGTLFSSPHPTDIATRASTSRLPLSSLNFASYSPRLSLSLSSSCSRSFSISLPFSSPSALVSRDFHISVAHFRLLSLAICPSASSLSSSILLIFFVSRRLSPSRSRRSSYLVRRLEYDTAQQTPSANLISRHVVELLER